VIVTRLPYLLLVTVLAASAAKHPSVTQHERSEHDARVARARARVAEIERTLPSAKSKVEKSLHGCGATTGALTGWMDGKKMLKIEARLFRPDGEVDRLFWFDTEGQVVYARIEGPKPVVPPAEGEPTPTPPAPSEYFFDKGEVFRWTSGPGGPPPEEMTATADELARGLRGDDSDVEC